MTMRPMDSRQSEELSEHFAGLRRLFTPPDAWKKTLWTTRAPMMSQTKSKTRRPRVQSTLSARAEARGVAERNSRPTARGKEHQRDAWSQCASTSAMTRACSSRQASRRAQVGSAMFAKLAKLAKLAMELFPEDLRAKSTGTTESREISSGVSLSMSSGKRIAFRSSSSVTNATTSSLSHKEALAWRRAELTTRECIAKWSSRTLRAPAPAALPSGTASVSHRLSTASRTSPK
mmetsp:Transcript_23237/g.72363  ORF Transcript_23237/g.72363 Transcript_23237/m.72363 type:complete len:233 (-) Transcript_23237:126-824(-)